MSNDDYVISLRKSQKGRQMPWLKPYQERFRKATQEAAEELKSTDLRGAARVIKFNQLVKEKIKALQGSESVSP